MPIRFFQRQRCNTDYNKFVGHWRSVTHIGLPAGGICGALIRRTRRQGCADTPTVPIAAGIHAPTDSAPTYGHAENCRQQRRHITDNLL